MSWQEYVDNQLVVHECISQAAIYGQNGSLWATSPGFSLSPEEVTSIVEAFGNAEKIQANGIFCNSHKYFALSHDETNIHGRMDKDGVIASKTKSAVIIVIYTGEMAGGNANKIVTGLADYLISQGY
ncbi:18218_t:CDS:2, partial [Acaulospora morrowiae]